MSRTRAEVERNTLSPEPQRHEKCSQLTPVSRVASLSVYAAIILYLGTMRIPPLPVDNLLSHDKILHAIAFGGLSVLAYRCLAYFWPTKGGAWTLGFAAGFSTLIGALLEILQSMLPFRAMEFGDLIADAIGALLFVALAKRMRLERPLFGLPL